MTLELLVNEEDVQVLSTVVLNGFDVMGYDAEFVLGDTVSSNGHIAHLVRFYATKRPDVQPEVEESEATE